MECLLWIPTRMSDSIENSIKSVIDGLALRFKSEEIARGQEYLNQLAETQRSLLKGAILSASSAAHVSEHPNGSPNIVELSTLINKNKELAAEFIEYNYKDASEETKDHLAFMLLHWESIESIASRWFSELEGGACSADRGRTLVSLLWSHFSTGKPLRFNYTGEYVFHLPKSSLILSEEIMGWYVSVRAMLEGSLLLYSMCFVNAVMRCKSRGVTPDLPDDYILPATDELSGRPEFQILASLWKHMPHYKTDPDKLAARVFVLHAGKHVVPRSWRELFDHDENASKDFSKHLTQWALYDTPIDVNAPGWPITLLPDNETTMEWLALYMSARKEGENMVEERAKYSAFISQQKERAENV